MTRISTLVIYGIIAGIDFCGVNAYTELYDSTSVDTTATNVGPLTTPFVAPSTCLDMMTKAPYGIPKLQVGCGEENSVECCPEHWSSAVYYSPGVCPSGYEALTLSTSKQRQETTNICCPSGYTLLGQISCHLWLDHPETLTYSDSTFSTKTTQNLVWATAIQVRFRASESDIVPVPTASLSLPRGFMLTREKVGIGIGATAGAVLMAVALYHFCWVRRRRGKKVSQAEMMPESKPSPPYDEQYTLPKPEVVHLPHGSSSVPPPQHVVLPSQLPPLRQDDRITELDPPPPYPGSRD